MERLQISGSNEVDMSRRSSRQKVLDKAERLMSKQSALSLPDDGDTDNTRTGQVTNGDDDNISTRKHKNRNNTNNNTHLLQGTELYSDNNDSDGINLDNSSNKKKKLGEIEKQPDQKVDIKSEFLIRNQIYNKSQLLRNPGNHVNAPSKKYHNGAYGKFGVTPAGYKIHSTCSSDSGHGSGFDIVRCDDESWLLPQADKLSPHREISHLSGVMGSGQSKQTSHSAQVSPEVQHNAEQRSRQATNLQNLTFSFEIDNNDEGDSLVESDSDIGSSVEEEDDLTPRQDELQHIRKSIHQRMSLGNIAADNLIPLQQKHNGVAEDDATEEASYSQDKIFSNSDSNVYGSHYDRAQTPRIEMLQFKDNYRIYFEPKDTSSEHDNNSVMQDQDQYKLDSHRSGGWTDDMQHNLGYKLTTLEHAATKKGKLVTFYKNGDPHFKGLKTSVSPKQFATFDTLLDWLTSKISTPKGVKFIFLLPDKTHITDIDQMANGRSYIVSSTKRIARETYGDSKEKHWNNRPLSNGQFRKGETSKLLEHGKVKKSRSFPTSRTSSFKSNNSRPNKLQARSEVAMTHLGLGLTDSKPRVLTLISNTHRDSHSKVILNPKTTQTYDEVLSDITDMLVLEHPPVSSLWTIRKPVKKVNGFSHLLRGLKNHDSFLAVGQERVPFEVLESPVRNNHKRQPLQHHNTRALQQAWNEDDFEDDLLPPPPKQQNHLQHSPRPQPESSHRDEVSAMRVSTTSPRMSPVMVVKDNKKQYLLRKSARHKHHPETNGYDQHPPPHSDRSEMQVAVREVSLSPLPVSQVKAQPIRSLPAPNRASVDHDEYRDSPLMITNGEVGGPFKNMPYHKPYEERESVTVHIHGFPRKFYAPRYGQHEPDGSKPKKKLTLDWVYGYRGRDMRNNLIVLPTEELVYFVSSVGIVFDVRSNHQRHYMEHDEDITCIALHPERAKPKIATGQMASHVSDEAAHIRVWDPLTMVTYAVVGVGAFAKSIGSIGFSTHTPGMEAGSLLMSVDEGEKHVMSIWNWQVDRLVAKTTSASAPDKTSGDTVVWGQFHPRDHTTLVTFGKNHVFFWKLFWDPETQAEGKILRDKKSGLFEADYLPKFVTSMAFSSSGDVITGDSNGRIVVWENDNDDAYVYNATLSAQMKNAHSKSVFVLTMLEDGTLISGGGHDIKVWDSLNGYKMTREKEVSTDYGFIRTVAQVHGHHGNNRLYVGTTQNCILHGTLRDIFEPLVMGSPGKLLKRVLGEGVTGKDWYNLQLPVPEVNYYEGPYEELWALATHPGDYTFVTAGVDQHVRKWDALNRALIWESTVEKPCLSLDLSPTGNFIALGTTVGRFIVLSTLDGMHIFSMQVGKAQLGVVKFSPHGEYVAIGSHDASIFIYEVEDEGRVFRRHTSGVLQGHNNFVTHIDWSRNGRYLRTVSGDYDLCFWSVEEMRQVSAKSMRNEDWFTETCVLSYNNLGAWSNLSESGDINTIDMAHKKDVMVVGENMGSIKLYKYPCTAERPYFFEQKKYSGHVTKVAFTFDDNFLITAGGKDAGILQWTVVNANHRS